MKKRRRLTTIILFLVFFAGLSLLLYPTVSDYWNSLRQSQAIASYSETVANLEGERYDGMLEEALEYNRTLTLRANDYALGEAQREAYEGLLDPVGTGVMGYIEIPSISCSLPIYHGTDESVLQVAVGHLEWSALPVGGIGTHSVLSGHRGLPSAKLFTNLDKLAVGDIFTVCVLNETLTYEVDQILIVEPHDTSALLPEQGEDLCTLVTCTPYGVNSHRLLVRGHRIETADLPNVVHVVANAMQIDPVVVAPIVAMPILLVLFIILMITPKRKNND
ncbi:MAG: class C sortase [Clostridia bacterium]|nr:class C sortase [Clostridia bacterium]